MEETGAGGRLVATAAAMNSFQIQLGRNTRFAMLGGMKLMPVLLVLLLCAIALGKEAQPAVDEKVLRLDPIKIRENAIIDFAVDIVIYVEPETKEVTHIFITKVHPGTDADKAGLQEGDEIVKLDGKPVKGLDPRIIKDSPLGRILLNRTPGEPLNLEVITHRKQEVTLRAQRDLSPYAR
jgi:membrane-associated protease RseP (regulator of RpoE activity)